MPEKTAKTKEPSNKDPRQPIDQTDALERFRAADWKKIQLELAMYAVYKVQRLHWKTSEGLPRGLLPQDLALGAIQKTMEGLMTSEKGKGIRRWDPAKEPDLLEFLKSVVDSDVNSLVHLDEHALNNYCPDISPDEAAKLLESSIDSETSRSARSLSAAPEAQLSAKQRAAQTESLYRRVMDELKLECRNDEDEMKVITALERLAENDEDLKPASVARLSGLTEERVRNAKRRIERRTRLIRERLIKQGVQFHEQLAEA